MSTTTSTKKTSTEKKAATKKKAARIPVLITTDNSKRGVFMGFIDPADAYKEDIEATEVRMAVYWSSDMKGVLGLASMGPSNSCKISKAVDKAIIKGVTAVMQISDEALINWRKEPWG